LSIEDQTKIMATRKNNFGSALIKYRWQK
jgi:hypothetical protein